MGTQSEITIADQVTNMSIGTNGVDSRVLDMPAFIDTFPI